MCGSLPAAAVASIPTAAAQAEPEPSRVVRLTQALSDHFAAQVGTLGELFLLAGGEETANGRAIQAGLAAAQVLRDVYADLADPNGNDAQIAGRLAESLAEAVEAGVISAD